MRLGGVRADHAVVEAFLETISPGGLEAATAAQALSESDLLDGQGRAHLVLRWKTGALSELDVLWKIPRTPALESDS